jgi:hypothetical protein
VQHVENYELSENMGIMGIMQGHHHKTMMPNKTEFGHRRTSLVYNK